MSRMNRKAGLRALPLPPAVWDGSYPLVLSDGWALTADENQWMLCRARGKAGKWQPIAFVGSNKRVLRRVMRERGVICIPEADAAVNALPDVFIVWRDNCSCWVVR